MAVRESLLNTITSVASSDFVRLVTSAGESSKATVANLADTILANFGKTATYTGNLNALTTNGYWYCSSGASNLPTGLTVGHLVVTRVGARVMQICVQYVGDATYVRTSADSGSTWGAWKAQCTFVDGSCTDTASSGSATFPIKYNNAYVYHDTYEVISAYESGHVIIPFISGSIWYVKVLNYSDMTPALNTQVTVNFRLLKK